MKKLVAFVLAVAFSASLAFSQDRGQQPPPPEKVVIQYNLVNAMATYLRKQPYEQVEQLLKALQSGLSAVPECPKEQPKVEKKSNVEKQSVPQTQEAPPKAE